MHKYRLGSATRVYHFQQDGVKKSVALRQIVALRDFADVKAGMSGGWVEDEYTLSQQGECWIYDENSVVFSGARIADNARLTRTCIVNYGAYIGGNAWIDGAEVGHGARIGDNVTVQQSRINGDCYLFGEARVLHNSDIAAARGMTADSSQRLQIYDRATVSRSRVVHQAQIYGDAIVDCAFIEHRAKVFDFALLQGNEENNVWICDCAQVYGHARIVAGTTQDAIPTLRYSARVAENAVVEGNCVLKHHVTIGGHAHLCGGPILLDDDVMVNGCARISGDVVIEHQVEIGGSAVIDARDGDSISLYGRKVVNGEQRIIRTPLPGSAG